MAGFDGTACLDSISECFCALACSTGEVSVVCKGFSECTVGRRDSAVCWGRGHRIVWLLVGCFSLSCCRTESVMGAVPFERRLLIACEYSPTFTKRLALSNFLFKLSFILVVFLACRGFSLCCLDRAAHLFFCLSFSILSASSQHCPRSPAIHCTMRFS